MQWMKDWLDSWPLPPNAKSAPKSKAKAATKNNRGIDGRIESLEQRIAELEAERGRRR
jgi:hypothetical protein